MTGWSSLPIDSWVLGQVHYIPNGMPPRFAIGDIDPAKTFVHVLTDGSLERVLGARDTITDFVSYIRKKELLVRGPHRVLAAGEDDLLPLYLRNMNACGEHDFVFPKNASGIRIKNGHWTFFENHEVRRAQMEANKVSYLWDSLIERFAKHAIEGTQYAATVPGVENAEFALRFLAKEDRTSRRMLSKAFLEIVEKGCSVPRATRYLIQGSDYAKYVFMTLKKPHGSTEEQYRIARQRMLEICCAVVKLKCPEAEDIVGIATEPGVNRSQRSEDSVYLDARDWAAEDFAAVERLAQEFDVGTDLTRMEMSENEYPTNDSSVASFIAGRE